MKTIEQLITENQGLFTEGLTVEFEYINHVENLCKAYMADQLSELEPKVYITKAWIDNFSKSTLASIGSPVSLNVYNKPYGDCVIPLYDLSELKGEK